MWGLGIRVTPTELFCLLLGSKCKEDREWPNFNASDLRLTSPAKYPFSTSRISLGNWNKIGSFPPQRGHLESLSMDRNLSLTVKSLWCLFMLTKGMWAFWAAAGIGVFLDPAPDIGSEGEIYRLGDVHCELTLLLDKLDRFQSVQL